MRKLSFDYSARLGVLWEIVRIQTAMAQPKMLFPICNS